MILFNKKRALILRGKPSVKINALFKLFPSRIQLTVVFSEKILSGCGEFCGSLVTDEGKRCEEIAKVFVYDLYLDLQLFSLCALLFLCLQSRLGVHFSKRDVG